MKSVIFDMDGTLFQTNKILELALEDTFNHLTSLGQWEGAIPLDKFRDIMGVPLPEVWATLLPNHSIEGREQINDYFQKSLVENTNSGKGALYPNVEQIFAHLVNSGFSLFIASNGVPAYLNAIVDYYQLDNWVSETFSIEQIESYIETPTTKVASPKPYGLTGGILE